MGKKMQLFPPPYLGESEVLVRSTISLLNNTLNGAEVAFDSDMSAFLAYEHNIDSCGLEYTIKNPYNVKGCESMPESCRRSDGLFLGPIYPNLLAKWLVTFDVPTEVKGNMVFPENDFDLAVEAEICYHQTSSREVPDEDDNGDCCADSGKFRSKDGSCQTCPEGSSARLNGYFCETCPRGFEPVNNKVSGYGCQKCAVDFYKADNGNAPCKPCEAGTSTGGTIGSSACV